MIAEIIKNKINWYEWKHRKEIMNKEYKRRVEVIEPENKSSSIMVDGILYNWRYLSLWLEIRKETRNAALYNKLNVRVGDLPLNYVIETLKKDFDNNVKYR